MSAGKKFRDALKNNNPLIIPGAINAYSAILAERAGHKAIYLSGGGVAAASYGLPDLGITSMEDVLIDVKRISNASSLPLLVDIDTGWGGAFNISRTDVNQFGELAAIDRVVLDTPTVSLDFSYYLANFANEANLSRVLTRQILTSTHKMCPIVIL